MAQKPNTFLKMLSLIDCEGGLNACWNWKGNCFTSQYGRFKMHNKTYLSHRLVYQYYYNTCLTKQDVVMHICDNPKCCNPLHLKKGTTADNVKDKMNKKRFVHKIKNNKCNKLKDTIKIISLYKQGFSQQKIAAILNCHRHTIRNHLSKAGFLMSS